MDIKLKEPDFIFESSWEVCNKVGGIYTVLSTRANILQQRFRDKIFFVGPDLWKGRDNPLFIEYPDLYKPWLCYAKNTDSLDVRIGKWKIPGNPIVILVDFQPFFAEKDKIYTLMWNWYQVDSLHAYGDYDEASMFSYAAGKVVESFYKYNLSVQDKVIYQAHEWMTGLGALYIRHCQPRIATIFTTHATSIGRSIAGNNKPLYDYLYAYNGDQMAVELNMRSKHSIEKQTAINVDCFTTVSEITNRECAVLLEKTADVVLMNGFENDFVPKGNVFVEKRKAARSLLFRLARCMFGKQIVENALIISISGRYEFKNKGIDVFLEAMNKLRHCKTLNKPVLAFVFVPGWVGDMREDLKVRMVMGDKEFSTPISEPYYTHWIQEPNHDRVLNMMRRLGMFNKDDDMAKVIFVPCYLDGRDGIINLPYYDVIIGSDLTVYPSYYEPWGYTPLESVAFHVPTITTDLAGFGRWVNSSFDNPCIENGVEVISRGDNNYFEVVEKIMGTIIRYALKNEVETQNIRSAAARVADQALWQKFINYYYKAYDLALNKADDRSKSKEYSLI